MQARKGRSVGVLRTKLKPRKAAKEMLNEWGIDHEREAYGLRISLRPLPYFPGGLCVN